MHSETDESLGSESTVDHFFQEIFTFSEILDKIAKNRQLICIRLEEIICRWKKGHWKGGVNAAIYWIWTQGEEEEKTLDILDIFLGRTFASSSPQWAAFLDKWTIAQSLEEERQAVHRVRHQTVAPPASHNKKMPHTRHSFAYKRMKRDKGPSYVSPALFSNLNQKNSKNTLRSHGNL